MPTNAKSYSRKKAIKKYVKGLGRKTKEGLKRNIRRTLGERPGDKDLFKQILAG